MKYPSLRFSIYPLMILLCLAFGCGRKAEKPDAGKKARTDLELDPIPFAVKDALKARFPQAEIREWTREEEGGLAVYDIEFRQEDRKYEADIGEDGAIHNWEKEIPYKDLPEAVKGAVQKKCPQSAVHEVMEITAVNDGKDTLEGYEIALTAADKKEFEVSVAPDGKILEDSRESQ